MEQKIIIDFERLRHPRCGIANIVKNLVLGLDALYGTEHFSLYAPKNGFPKDFPVFKILEYKFWHKKFQGPFRVKFPIIHVSHQLSRYFYHKQIGQKKIVTLHDLNFLYEHNKNENVRARRIRRVNKNIKNADIVVCISEFVKNDFIKNQHLFSLPKNQEIKVIYNGLKFPDFEKINDPGQFSYLRKKPYILNIGVLFPKKNQLSLLKMLPYIEEDLVLVVSESKKNYEEETFNFIAKNNLENRVHILRNISDEEKWWLIKNATAMLHPSLAEGFGIPPIEAMYFEKPVFLSKLTSLPEIGGDDAFYFENFDPKHMAETFKKGMEVYNNCKEEFGKRLRERAEKFSYLKMAKEYFDLYKSLGANIS